MGRQNEPSFALEQSDTKSISTFSKGLAICLDYYTYLSFVRFSAFSILSQHCTLCVGLTL